MESKESRLKICDEQLRRLEAERLFYKQIMESAGKLYAYLGEEYARYWDERSLIKSMSKG